MRAAAYEHAVPYEPEQRGATLTQRTLLDFDDAEVGDADRRGLRGKCSRLVLGVSSLYVYAVCMVVNYAGAQGHSKY